MMSLAGLAFILLSTIAAGGLAYAFLQPRMAAVQKVESRRSRFSSDESERASIRETRDRLQDLAKRRKNIQSSIKEMEARQKERNKNTAKPSLQRRMEQAGWTISKRGFVIASIASGLVSGILGLILGLSLLPALGVAIVGGLGLPRLALARARKKRLDAFTEEFPNAVDLIVRGVKSGLPLNDTLRMISTETVEPVRGEFQKIIESQRVGVSTVEAVERLYRSVPTAETNFFAIVIGIQAQAGGNLSEALGNLSRVLRDRKKMKAKIQAMSMEAKASGGIIGALPFVVAALVYLTTPDYITILFTTGVGHVVLLASAFWMAIGIFVMKKMINFDF